MSEAKSGGNDAPRDDSDSYSAKKNIDAVSHIENVDEYNSKPRQFDNSIDDTKPSRKVWTIIFTVAMGGFLFGEKGSVKPLLLDRSSWSCQLLTNCQNRLRYWLHLLGAC